MRTQKTVGSTVYNYYYADGLLIRQTWGTNYMDFLYDESGSPYSFIYNGTQYYYIKNLQGDVMRIVNTSGTVVANYSYDAWGKVTNSGNIVGLYNPIRYRGYYYDTDTGFYYLQSRYYDPTIKRFISADGIVSGVGGELLGYNQYAYCFNNPVNSSDSSGNWPKWLSGAINAVAGVAQMAAGAALGAFTSWTGVGAVAAGILMINGAAMTTQGIGQIVNDVTKSNIMREDNLVKTGVQDVGRFIDGDAGAETAGNIYDIAVIAANLYVGKVCLQQAGKLPIKVNINNIVNNPLDEFVTIGPADGVIEQYCRTIPQSGYGQIYVTQLENGLYQIANGHHRVAALRMLGYTTIKIFLTK